MVIIIFYIVDHHVLIDLAADVMPAGDLLKYQQADLVTALQKILRLHIVGGADCVAGHIITDEFRVLSLDTPPHGIADVGVTLMAIDPAKLDFLSV